MYDRVLFSIFHEGIIELKILCKKFTKNENFNKKSQPSNEAHFFRLFSLTNKNWKIIQQKRRNHAG